MKANKFHKIAMLQTFLLSIVLNITAQAAGVDPRVVQELTTNGQVKTVIALNLPETTPNRLRTAIAMRDPIGETQEEVLNSLPTGSYELTYQYSHVPGLALTVTPESFAILKDHPQVKYIQYDELEHVALAQAITVIHADQVYSGSPSYNGNGVTVAVLDTGINTTHNYFTNVSTGDRIIAQTCYLVNNEAVTKCPSSLSPYTIGTSAEDGHGHGSHVSGIVAKVAPGAKIAAVKVCNNSGECHVSDVVAGLDWVKDNHSSSNPKIKVVNISIASSTLYSDSCDVEDPTRKAAIDSLIGLGITVFAAAGNNGDKTKMGAPACLSNTIAVGATYDDNLASSIMSCINNVAKDSTACFSNSNLWLDILAPGSRIISSWTGSSSAEKAQDGTSMASPMAAGVAALMLQKNPNLTPAQIKAKLKKTGVNVTDTNGIIRPRIDALAAVNDANTDQAVLEIIENGSYLRDQAKLDFGWTITGSPVTKTLTLKNSGTAALTLNFSSLSSGFSLISSFPTTINANSQQTVQIKLNATTANNYGGTLNFTTNDPVNSPVQIALIGKVCNVQTVPFSENFESGLPYCWRTLSNDFSTRDWDISTSPNIYAINENKSIAAITASPTNMDNDDWLILPKITLGNNSKLEFKARKEVGYLTETFEVRLLTSGSEPTLFSNFLNNSVLLETEKKVTATIHYDSSKYPPVVLSKDAPNLYSYSLNSYAGQSVYLAIRNVSPATRENILVIDDISVTDSSAPNYQNSTPTIDKITSDGANLTVRLDEAGTVYYLVKTDSDVASATDVTSGKSFTVNAANVDVTEAITGLSPNTAYTIYIVAKDTSGTSTSVSSESFTTPSAPVADTTPPNFISGTPSISGITSSSFTLTLGSNETSTVYYVILPNSSSTPTAAAIKSSGASSSLSANTLTSQTITGLTANTSYTIYAVLTDNALNQSAVAPINSTTAAVSQPSIPSTPAIPPSYTVIERKDGTGSGKITSVYVGQSGWTSLAALSATPDSDSIFIKWTGNIYSPDCYSDQPTIYVRLNAVKTCTATFDKITADNQSLIPIKLAAYYLPGVENSGQAFIRITNTNTTPATVKGTLYHASGQQLGIANSTLIQSLAPQATVELTVKDLAKLSSAPAWTGLAWLHITTPSGLNLLNLLENDNKMVSNLTSISTDNVLYNLPPSTDAEQTSILLINTRDKIQPVTATLYGINGQILGKANTVLADVAARGIFNLSIKQLEILVGTSPWTGQVAKLQITTPDIKTMAIVLSQEASIINLTPTHDNAAFNIPGATNSDQATIYITNTTNSMSSVTATLYHQDGYLLGTPNTLIINSLAPQATQTFSISELEKLFNVPTWEKRARLQINTPSSGIKIMTVIHNSFGISNLSSVSNQVYYLPNASHADKAYIRITNTTDLPTTFTGVMYGENGQILGSGVLLSQLEAQTTTVISMLLLENLLKTNSWTGKTRLVLNPSSLQVMGTIRSNTGQLLNMSDISHEE